MTTDADGLYSFDLLPVLAAGDSYTVTIDASTASALAGYLPAQTGQGTTGTDSSTGSASSDDLISDGDADVTLDFGFVAPVMDLALRIQLDDQTNLATVSIGDDVTFVVTVENQGTVDADDVDLVVYIPTGLTLNDPDWVDNGDGTASRAYSGVLSTGASGDIEIDFTVNSSATGTLDIWSEIAGATAVADGVEVLNPDGSPIADIDSTPDANNSDAFNTDDDTSGTPANGDEDDHDRVQLQLATSTAPPLAFTGTDSRTAAMLASLLVVVGVILARSSRRRMHQI